MSATLVEALDAIPSNLADCTAEDFKNLSGAVNGLDAETEVEKEAVIRLTKVVDRLIQNWVKRGGKLPNKKKKKTEEEGKEGEEAAEPAEEEKDAAPRDPVVYHKALVSLTAAVQAFAALSAGQVRKMHASLRLLVTPVDELKQKKKDAKKDAAPKDDVVLSSEVLDAIRIIQKFQIGEKDQKGKKGGKAKKDAPKEEEPKKKRTRNRNRKPRGKKDEAKDAGAEGEENTPEADNNEPVAEAKVETVEAPAAEAVAA